jgi:hypothetical protein
MSPPESRASALTPDPALISGATGAGPATASTAAPIKNIISASDLFTSFPSKRSVEYATLCGSFQDNFSLLRVRVFSVRDGVQY